MKTQARMTLDDALRPLEMTCSKCGGQMKAYPCPIPEGVNFCHTCSPAWLEDFARWLMNKERARRRLQLIEVAK